MNIVGSINCKAIIWIDIHEKNKKKIKNKKVTPGVTIFNFLNFLK